MSPKLGTQIQLNTNRLRSSRGVYITEINVRGYIDLRLLELNLTSLKIRRTRSDLVEMFKVQKGHEKIVRVKSSSLIKHTGREAWVRGNALRLHRESFKARLSNYVSQSVT